MSEISQTERVPDEELDQMIWKLERYGGMTPKLLSLMREMREVRRAKPYGYVNQALYEEIGCSGLTNDHEAYADSSTHIPLYRIPQAASAVKPAMLNAEKLNQPVSETEALTSGYLQGHQDGLEWAAQMAEANHPQTGDWLYDDPIALAAAIRKGPDMLLASGNSPVTPDGWIPVSERMPERDYVLAADFSGAYYPPNLPDTQVGIYADWFEDGNPSWDDGDGNDLHLKQVTHWMKLTAAPKEVG